MSENPEKPAAEGQENAGGDRPAGGDGEHVNLRVVNQNGEEVYFKIKKTTPLRKLMEAYCQRQGVQMTSLRFLFDGARLTPEQTPKDIDLEDNDVIDAVVSQTGGY